VWEASAGTTVPSLSRNLTRIDEHAMSLAADTIMPRLISLSL
jgi:hypothetical protein